MENIKLRVYNGHTYLGTSHLSLCGSMLTFFNFEPEPFNTLKCKKCLDLLKQRKDLGLLPKDDGKPVNVIKLSETEIKLPKKPNNVGFIVTLDKDGNLPKEPEGVLTLATFTPKPKRLSGTPRHCPFCKHSNITIQEIKRDSKSNPGKNYQAMCNKCKSRGPLIPDKRVEAIKGWNSCE